MRSNLIGRKKYKINDKISIHIPTLNEIRGESDDDEIQYNKTIIDFITTSTNYMVELYDCGINFEDLEDDYSFFIYKNIINKESVFPADCHLLFEDVYNSDFRIIQDNDNYYVVDNINDIVIDREIFNNISEIICKTMFIEKKHRKFANERSRKYAVEREKKVRERNKNKHKTSSNLDEVILFAVNNSNFKYDFNNVMNLTIYDFYASIKQIQKNESVEHLMLGGYTGNLKLTEFSHNDLSKFNVL